MPQSLPYPNLSLALTRTLYQENGGGSSEEEAPEEAAARAELEEALPLLAFAHEQFVPPRGLTRTFLPLLLCLGCTLLVVGVPDRLRLRSNMLRHFGREGG